MLKKLRRKFIAIAMLSVSIVLIAIVGMINIANYISTNEALDARLKLIAGNGGTFPDLLEQKNMGVGSNKKNDENTNTGTESTSTDTENANTDTFGNKQMKVQIKRLQRSKSHHPAEQMYSHRRI